MSSLSLRKKTIAIIPLAASTRSYIFSISNFADEVKIKKGRKEVGSSNCKYSKYAFSIVVCKNVNVV